MTGRPASIAPQRCRDARDFVPHHLDRGRFGPNHGLVSKTEAICKVWIQLHLGHSSLSGGDQARVDGRWRACLGTVTSVFSFRSEFPLFFTTDDSLKKFRLPLVQHSSPGQDHFQTRERGE